VAADKKLVFFQVTYELFEAFRAAGLGNKPKRLARRKKEDDDNQYKNIKKVVKIITEISELRQPDSAKHAYHGISVIINAMTKELLAIPKMAELYYGAVLSILKIHSSLLHAISEDLFKNFIEVLSFPLRYNTIFTTKVIEKTLNGIGYMFATYFIVMNEGKNIFGNRKNIVNLFIDMIIEFLLFGDIFTPNLEVISSDVYFLAMAFDENRYQLYIQQTVGNQEPGSQHLIFNYFNQLRKNSLPENLLLDLESNKLQFRKNFQTFLCCSRGILKKKKSNAS